MKQKLTKANLRFFNRVKTHAIILLITYIVGCKLVVLPINTVAKLVLVASGILMWFVSVRENNDLGKLSYFAPFMIGWLLAA